MAQKWHQKATVQAAIASGAFVLFGAIITGLFMLYSAYQTRSPEVDHTPKKTGISQNRDPGQSSATLDNRVQDLNKRLAKIVRYVGLLAETRTGVVVLIGEQVRTDVTTPLTAHDVAFVLKWAKEIPPQRIGCAYEPIQDKFFVTYFGGTKDTSTGHLLFNADKVLKEYQMGVRFNGKKVLSSVSGYAPLKVEPLDFQREMSEPRFTRIWLADNAVVVSDRNQQASWLEKTGLKILAMSMILREGKMVEVDLSGSQARFVRSFSSQLNDYIQEEPALAGVDRLTQLISLARAISNALMSINLELSGHHFPGENTPTEIPLIRVSYEVNEQSSTGNLTHTIECSGGIDLGRTPSFRESDTLFQSLISQLPIDRSKLALGETVYFEVSGNQYIGLVVNPAK